VWQEEIVKKLFSLGTYIGAVFGLIAGVIISILIIRMGGVVPNGFYVSRLEFAAVSAVLVSAVVFLVCIVLHLVKTVDGLGDDLNDIGPVIEDHIAIALFDDRGRPKHVQAEKLDNYITADMLDHDFGRRVQEELDQIEEDKRAQERAEEERGMDELNDLRKKLDQFDAKKFKDPAMQARFELLTAKYGQKLDLLDQQLSVPTTTHDPVVVPASAPATKMVVKRRKNAAS
jgi:hypothetical protein